MWSTPFSTSTLRPWTAWAAPSATWLPPSPAWPSAGSASAASRRRSTPPPRRQAVFHVFAALAESEPDPIRERTSGGLAAARARGRHRGRPSVLTAHKLHVARELYRSGQDTVAAVATTLGVSRTWIYRHLDRAGG
jgi:DNA invertase Pin-like site-specific DNA recombinase